MSTASVRPRPRPQCLLMHDVDWRTYGRLLRAFAERPGVRLTYDRGALEIRSPLYEHDSDADFLGRLVAALTEELRLTVRGGGSTTLRRRKKRRGLEPDRCYWIANEPKIRAKRRIDLRLDPPPDLAIEVDVTRSSLDRMSLYAALGVPEVWRLVEPALTFHVLGPEGKYAEAGQSLSFPQVTPADLTRLLAQRASSDDNTLIAQLRTRVRQPPTP